MNDFQVDYLFEVLSEIRGVGKHTASKIISLKDDFNKMGQLSEDDLVGTIKNQEIRNNIVIKLGIIDFTKPLEELRTEKVLEKFLDSQFSNLKELKLEDLEINALLIKALGFTTAEETVDFYLYQRVTRARLLHGDKKLWRIFV